MHTTALDVTNEVRDRLGGSIPLQLDTVFPGSFVFDISPIVLETLKVLVDRGLIDLYYAATLDLPKAFELEEE